MGHTKTLERAQRKTERSHVENQERAYIAASRRADRSTEARVKSALMASEIHKKRTGKAFRITEKIVLEEEMYEEEDDDLSRFHRLLGRHMRTASAEMDSRVDAYLTNRLTMSQLLSATEADWRDDTINRTFAHFFPLVDRQAQYFSRRWSTSGFPMPLSQKGRVSSPKGQSRDPNFDNVDYGQQPSHGGCNRSLPGILSSKTKDEGAASPPALMPSELQAGTPQSRPASVFNTVMPPSFIMENSAFAVKLPLESKMLRSGVSPVDTVSPSLYGEAQSWESSNAQSYNNDSLEFDTKEEGEVELSFGGDQYLESFVAVYSGPGYATPSKNLAEELSWDTFINDNASNTEQQ
ncbi:hypothetical protein IWW34DRAFT_908237 [Fusarium oxysporum f. sp. albedinis]|nr:hypothetical protein IWW34DRAFT_908237 [Fusarium oxysporum f. sp. albedinis]KAK2470377.1 hypothetical protein H9L39_17994 [Fusarium oxysporum f. sp. albedinis]